jgi:hypothetical protein
MNIHFWSFAAGAFFILAVQHLACIPAMRRHRMKMALLARAETYRLRAQKLSKDGNDYEALKAWAECMALINQVKAIK